MNTLPMPVTDHWDKLNWKPFPQILIPWEMISPHDEQAKRNHAGQDLAKLRQRHGISSCEALAILDDRKWREMDPNEAHEELVRRVNAFVQNGVEGTDQK